LFLESESEDDDDNITVTVPPAYQQSRGATFRDSRLRRIPSHNIGESSHPSTLKSHPDDEENYEEEITDSHSSKQQGNMQRPGYERSSSSSHSQGISTLVGEEKNGSQGYHHSSSRNSNHTSDSQNIYQQQTQHHQPIFNQNQSQTHNVHSGMMGPIHSHSMYPQGSYHQSSGPYFSQNQMRFVSQNSTTDLF
jgi:hypothetical protein